MKYQVLIVDHDDTAIDSSRELHHPAHVEVMKELRPNEIPCDFNTWMEKNHGIGISKYLLEELQLTAQERAREVEVWRKWTSAYKPKFYPGFLQMLKRFSDNGGIVAVCSHSEENEIKRHYSESGIFTPHYIYGWNETDHSKMKPNPFPVYDILNNHCKGRIDKEHCCVLDDLSTGIKMARAAGVHAFAAGWGHSVPSIIESMKSTCDHYFSTVQQLSDFLFC